MGTCRAPDDMTALAELCVLLGSAQVKEVARTYGRKLLVSVETDPQVDILNVKRYYTKNFLPVAIK